MNAEDGQGFFVVIGPPPETDLPAATDAPTEEAAEEAPAEDAPAE